MKKLQFTYLILLGILISCGTENPQKPPLAPVKVVADTLFGMIVEDQHRYMEDLSDSTVVKWIIICIAGNKFLSSNPVLPGYNKVNHCPLLALFGYILFNKKALD